MPNVIKLKKGLDIRLVGEAAGSPEPFALPSVVSISPLEFGGVVPKLLVRVDDAVQAGTPLFFDKNSPRVMFTSPVSGKVIAVNRGEKRKILSIDVEVDREQSFREFDRDMSDAGKIRDTLLQSGLWPCLIQRPYGVIASPEDTPRSIFVSGFDSAPLAPDTSVVLADRMKEFAKGIEVLGKLTQGGVFLGVDSESSPLAKVPGAKVTVFSGPHPAGNVGVQIHHIDPVRKGEKVWTADPVSVAAIGALFLTGRLQMSRVIALCGSKVSKPRYVTVIPGTRISDIHSDSTEGARVINGNVLTGTATSAEGSVGLRTRQITVIPEMGEPEAFGWIRPRFGKFSVSRSYFSWLCPKKRYDIDTCLNGGPRAFVVTGLYEDYLPMDIYPMYLLKAAMAGDIERMERLGIYEVIPEDLALCEFVCPSKIEIQQVIADGIGLMIKELS